MGICTSNEYLKIQPSHGHLISKSEVSNAARLEIITKHYDFIKVLGYGQFGTVREAIKISPHSKSATAKSAPSNQIHYAVKSISKERLQDSLDLLKNELMILQLVDHPNIIKLYETYEDAKYIHLVTELCEGGDLYEYLIDRENLSENEVTRIMQKVLSAVNHLHALHICHRDIKPENFMLTSKKEGAELKLIDFGLSVRFGEDGMDTKVGTPYFLAPEILRGGYGKECDIWSTGVMMYFLLANKYPFGGAGINDLLRNIQKANYSFSDLCWKQISPQAKDLIARMLVVPPPDRITINQALRHEWFTMVKDNCQIKIDGNIFDSLKKHKARGKLWQEAMKVLVRNLSQEQLEGLQNIFKEIDRKQTGFITADDIRTCMDKNGFYMAREEFNMLISNIEYLGNGKLNYTQFLIAALDKKKIFDDETLWMTFNHFDIDGNGSISVHELRFVLEKAGCYISDTDMDEILGEFQLESGGTMNFEEFKSIMWCFSNDSSEISTENDDLLYASRRGMRMLSQRKMTIRRTTMMGSMKKLKTSSQCDLNNF
ncbi:unnamed protein product [Blepharisma stoltei]|uniref:Calcium-dependent protein kinase n=1 Tax=Blepharisma stoltei TaxID=1481888 RepID=A0AAU9J5I4_9CILI|nr:unnamed protein product [Blepharisma stoltei]